MHEPRKIRNKVNIKEAMYWTDDSRQDVMKWMQANNAQYTLTVINDSVELRIYTLEGHSYPVPFGWWIIKGVKDEFYPCEHEVFFKSYEFVEESQD
jgi:hypothetical protein